MEKEKTILKVMLVIEHDGKLLAGKGYDEAKDEHFYRLLGGGVNFQETTEEAIRREIKEELDSEIEDLRLLDTVENIFEYNGEKGHEICFIYDGELANTSLFNKEKIHIVEETYEFDAHWVPVREFLEKDAQLYPKFDYKNFLKNRKNDPVKFHNGISCP